MGMSNQKKINFYGFRIKPMDFLSFVLKRMKPHPDYREHENLWLKVTGQKDGQEVLIEMECLVPTIPGWEDAGCNIDTGFPASLIAQMIKNGIIADRGSFAPEGIVPVEPFFASLAKKHMIIYENDKIINRAVRRPMRKASTIRLSADNPTKSEEEIIIH